MPAIEVVRDMPPKILAPVDESVVVPASVRRAAEIANSFYTAAPQDPPAQPDAPPAAVAPSDAPPAAAAQPDAPPAAAAPPVAPEPIVAPSRTELDDSEWARRYNSMKGRWEAAQQTIGSMQEQMQQLGDELVRTQQLLQSYGPAPGNAPPATPKLITAEDEQAYGTELIDVVQRAARQAIAPELDAVKAENEQLRQRVQRNSQAALYDDLSDAVPNWREINKNPRFKAWLRLPDVYSGTIRQKLLNEAMQAAQAPRVISFFKGFVTDEAATGHTDPAPQPEPAVAPPRIAAVPLEVLAAPGRAKPAAGDTNVPADKPIFTRVQISKFYDDVRRQVYAGRETEKSRLEQEIFAAQREGRVRG